MWAIKGFCIVVWHGSCLANLHFEIACQLAVGESRRHDAHRFLLPDLQIRNDHKDLQISGSFTPDFKRILPFSTTPS